MTIDIPNYKSIKIENIVLDYNGTIAKDGKLKQSVKNLLPKLSKHFKIFVITADTFGNVKKELNHFDIEIKILKTNSHTKEKAKFVEKLGNTIAIGNGNNDAQMLQKATISIAIIGDEGCSTQTLQNSQIVCKKIKNALELPLNPKRLIATLRR